MISASALTHLCQRLSVFLYAWSSENGRPDHRAASQHPSGEMPFKDSCWRQALKIPLLSGATFLF
jgi:hypothetical protein